MCKRVMIVAAISIGCIAVTGVAFAGGKAGHELNLKLMLKQGWSVQSSAKIKEGGEVLSMAGFTPQDWYPASMPSTVLAALVKNGEYPDPYFGMNLNSIPGSWPHGLDVSSLPMTPFSPFRHSWWYRSEFELPASYEGKRVWLNFDGINFRANIWLNSHIIADSDQVAGTFRSFEFDITDLAMPGKTNSLAVEVFPPRHHDLAFTWVDWNPAPPDRSMGIWRDVYITASGPVALRFPHVITDLEIPSLDKAHLTVTVYVKNATDQAVTGTLKGAIGKIRFSQELELGPKEQRAIIFSPEKFPQLNISNPLLWWPATLGPQNLYDLEMEFECAGQVSDRQNVRFGIREITSDLTPDDWRVFKFNGKNILIRGAGWCPDMMFRFSPERVEAEVRYAREMNLNTIRLEGKLESDDLFYDICDEMGILVLPGWCCCHHWERWRKWDSEDYRVAEASQRDQALRLRTHPCILGFLYGSDNPPPPDVERAYLNVFEECMWPNPSVSSAAAKPTKLTGPSGIKMTGPYEYVPPVYWYADTKRGGAFGFTAETSPGPAVPPVESLRLMLPEDHLWPIDKYWNYHAGRNLFGDVKVFTKALNARYGEATGVDDYAMKAQAMTYDGQRAMFEAFARNKYNSTGVIQWMLNDAWPSIIWHLYDYYLRPAGGYFGTKKACEPIHVQYSYDDRSIVVVNSFYREFKDMNVSARIYNLDMTEKFFKDKTVDIPPDSSTRVFTLPEPSNLTRTYFVKLDMEDADGAPVSSNFYWLSTKPDVLAWNRSSFSHTPTKSHADLTGLNTLPEVELNVSSRFEKKGQEGLAHVTLENPTPHLAFLVHLKITKGPGAEEVLPVFWQDNYFPLMPGEKRTITAAYRMKDMGDATPIIQVDGWNVAKNSY